MSTNRTREGRPNDDDRAGLFVRGDHGPNRARVPLLGVDVRAEVVAGHARVIARQRYRNDEARPVEAVYTFPLPTRGAVSGFSMTVNARQLVGEVHEREDAFRHYEEAISAGHGSALLEQERPNVFTANVGNLLPGEETVIEIEYVEPLQGDEGAVRWTLPTLIAPRYMPGNPSGDRTAHGTVDPTTRVPDADRISPPIGATAYGLSLELVFDLGRELEVESPSHDVRVERVATGSGSASSSTSPTRVSFLQPSVALDRDVVITAYPKKSAFAAAPIASVVAHRAVGGGAGAFAVSLVPDLAGASKRRDARQDVVFVLDRSGSMGGASMSEAKTALRLCLRQLREGDRFAVIAFDESIETMAPALTPLAPSTLRAADQWIDSIDARGGTEMLEPLVRAMELAPSGIIVLLTDGQVGNEDEIQTQLLAKRVAARVYSFGIGTNVSDALLVALAEKTGGAVEMIYPGERVDDKVVAQFARATAPRVTDLKLSFRGVDVGEVAPAEPESLVDGEPFTIFGTYEAAGVGAVEIRGMYEGEKFFLEVPIDLPETEQRPAITKLWAQARIRDLERAVLSGRRAESMKDRIVKLAKEHGVSSRYTSFIVVEKRAGDRRVNEQPETRVVPVNAPLGWDPYKTTAQHARQASSSGLRMSIGTRASFSRPPAGAPMRAMAAPGMAPPPMASSAMARPMEPRTSVRSVASTFGASAGPSTPRPFIVASPPTDPLTAVLERQSASGLWEEAGRDPVEATVDALLVLVRLGVTTLHPTAGAQTKKAVDALLEALASAAETGAQQVAPELAELALAVLWLLSTGRRTRVAIKDATASRPGLEGLAAALGRDDDVRAHVERIAPMC